MTAAGRAHRVRARRGAAAVAAALLAVACTRTVAERPGGGTSVDLTEERTRLVDVRGRLGVRLHERIQAAAPAEVGLTYADLATGATVQLGGGTSMHAASTMKVPVLYELARQSDAGRLSLDAPIGVKNTFTSIADGSTYTLTPEDDSENDLYELVGTELPARELARRMIVRSSNLATNILIERLGADNVQRTMAGLGAEDMRVLRGVEDIPAYRRGMNNTATAASFARVLTAIARCEGLRPTTCDEVVDILKGQEFDSMIPAGLPPGTPVAHKTGWITGIHHDGGIVYPPGREPYVLVVLTRGIEGEDESARLVADLSRIVWEHATRGAAAAAGGGGARGARAPSSSERAGTPGVPRPPGTDPEALARLHDAHRVPAISEREFTHEELWAAMDSILEATDAFTKEELGRSAEGRPIYLLSWGEGSMEPLLWSQMHGDESTATMALLDIVHFLATEPEHPLARTLRENVTLHLIPMLNPDGAERFQRRNALGIDINRDARHLATPEGRALKAAQERLRPDFGFNLHDQSPRTRVGPSDFGAAIALLAPPYDDPGSVNASRLAALRLASHIRMAMEPLVPGHIARYDDSFNPRAFGDLMQQWGVSTVLVESGGWEGDPEKQHLRKTNFVGLLSALEGIATGAYAQADPAWYAMLPQNGRRVNDLLLVGGTLVPPGLPAYRADIEITWEEPGVPGAGRISDIGDLDGIAETTDTLDLTGLFLHPDTSALRPDDEGRIMASGRPASFVVRRGAEPTSAMVWVIEEGVARRPED